ncbi:MAG: ABC transporter permease [Lachnospiraceae bacterium]|nr:ABC transporter permease [Lachnospiraceae bacterium]
MRKYIGLAKRNLLIYFKDIQSVIFSMITPIIVLVLYILFLKGTFVDPINTAIEGLEDFVTAENVDMFVNGLLLTGILGSTMITVPYNCLITIVRDREGKIDYDISATPVKRVQIVLAYFTASAISAFLMAAIILSAGLVLMMLQGNLYLGAADVAKLYGITLLGAVSATALFMIVVLFFKTSSATGAFFGILSAAAGFVIGAYIPISQFSEGVQTFCNIFPGSGITILYRNVLLNPLLNQMNASIGGLDEGMFVDTLKEIFVFDAHLFGNVVGTPYIVLMVCGVAAVCIAAIAIIYPKVYQRK